FREVVILEGRDRFVKRNMKIEVEITAVGGIEGKDPAFFFLVVFDLRKRPAGDIDQRGIARMQVFQQSVRNIVGAGRTTWTALVQRLTVFPQPHNVIDDKLAATDRKNV